MPLPKIDLASLSADHRLMNDPPGMWSGFVGQLPDLKIWYPRAGVGHLSLSINNIECASRDEAKAVARRLAWERYEAAHARAKKDGITTRDLFSDWDGWPAST